MSKKEPQKHKQHSDDNPIDHGEDHSSSDKYGSPAPQDDIDELQEGQSRKIRDDKAYEAYGNKHKEGEKVKEDAQTDSTPSTKRPDN